jgi:hypothetical protein
MLIAQAFIKLLHLWEIERLSALDQKFIQDRVIIVLFQALVRTLQSQQKNGSWGPDCFEATAYAIIALANFSSLPFVSCISPQIEAAVKSGREFLQTRPLDSQPEYLWIEKVSYASNSLSKAYTLSALNISVPTISLGSKVGSLTSFHPKAINKFSQFFGQLPLYKNVSQWKLQASLIEGYLFLPILKSVRLDIFLRSGMEEDKYLEYIPFTWTGANNRDSTYLTAAYLHEMMVLSMLTYQCDEYMEAVAGRHFEHRLDDVRNVIEHIFEGFEDTKREHKATVNGFNAVQQTIDPTANSPQSHSSTLQEYQVNGLKTKTGPVDVIPINGTTSDSPRNDTRATIEDDKLQQLNSTTTNSEMVGKLASNDVCTADTSASNDGTKSKQIEGQIIIETYINGGVTNSLDHPNTIKRSIEHPNMQTKNTESTSTENEESTIVVTEAKTCNPDWHGQLNGNPSGTKDQKTDDRTEIVVKDLTNKHAKSIPLSIGADEIKSVESSDTKSNQTAQSSQPPSTALRANGVKLKLEPTENTPSLKDVATVLTKFVMHILQHPNVLAASAFDRARVARELKIYLLAHVQQTSDNSRFSTQNLPTDSSVPFGTPNSSYYAWVQSTSSDHTSCPFAFAFVNCLLSKNGTDFFATAEEKYVGEDLCRQLAVTCRQYNDYGSVPRDRAEKNLNSINFPEFFSRPQVKDDDLKNELYRIAMFEKRKLDMSITMLEDLCRERGRGRVAEAVKMFVNVTDSYGQIYMIRDIASRM